jgi:adenosylhomocysteine nucleosidase
MIAITFALPAESAGLVARLRDGKRVACGDSEIIAGKIDNRDVGIFHTGVGPKVSASRMHNFLRAETPAFLISSGFAGGVSDDLEVGNLIVAENFCDPDLISRWKKDQSSKGTARAPTRLAKLFSSDTIADSVEQRNEIARTQGADAVDMETESIAQACAARAVPMFSLRVISDTPAAAFPAPPRILFDIAQQRTNYMRLLSYLVRHPTTISGLARFARQISGARETLTEGIVDLMRGLDL